MNTSSHGQGIQREHRAREIAKELQAMEARLIAMQFDLPTEFQDGQHITAAICEIRGAIKDAEPEECAHGNTPLDKPATCDCSKSYVISARRSNGEAVYYVSTNAEKMVPNAPSIAYRFGTRADALAGIGNLRQQYAGLMDWKVEVSI